MASLPEVSRYTDLISYIPSGSRYENLGTVIPYRFGSTEIRLETSTANTKYGLYVNDKYKGTYFSDSQGNVVFSAVLDRGDVEFKLVNLATGAKQVTWVTVREYALWLAAYAEVLESLDADTDRVYNSLFVNQVEADDAEDRFGTEIDTYRDTGISLPDYRRQLHELRLGYRNWGSRYRGLEHAVADFTQVPPFGYQRRKWGPNWVLDQSMVKNHRFEDRGHTLTYGGAGVSGVTLISAEPDVVQSAGTHVLDYIAASPDNLLRWSPGGVAGPSVVANDGMLFLPGPASTVPAFALGLLGAYSIVAGTNDHVYLDIDNKGSIDIQLTTGLPTPTAAQVATDVNTALVADIRYGAGYATAASSYDSKILIEAQNDGDVLVEHGVKNAALNLFGDINGALVFSKDLGAGIYPRKITTLTTALGAASIVTDTSVSPATVAWRGPGAGLGATVNIDGDAEYTVTDTLGNVLVVYIVEDELTVAGAPVTTGFTVGYRYEREPVEQTQGLWVLVDAANLPGGSTNDTVTLEDDATLGAPETPDNWFITLPASLAAVTTSLTYSDVTNSRLNPTDPASAYSWNVAATGSSNITVQSSVHLTPMPRPGPRGSSFPQRSPGLLYDYEGYTVRFGIWARNNGLGTTTATVGFSFDGGSTWDNSAAQIIVQDSGGSKYEPKTYIYHETIIPAGVTDNEVLVNVAFTSVAANTDVDIDSPRVDVKYISSAYLGNATVARSRHRQYFGELLWIWSPDELSLTEKEYIGLHHKKPNKRGPFAGVELLTISSDTDAGTGTMTYRYNRIGDVRELKWDAPGTTWGVGLGWNVLGADGSYTLTASDGSTVSVYVTYASTPVLTGTPPAVEATSSITISDTTIKPGHARKIAPAHSSIDIFDVTEYDSTTGAPINLVGVIKEGDFAPCTSYNLDIQTSDPFRYSYMYPNVGPVSAETVAFNSATYLASLTYESDQDQTNAVLYIDDVPLFNTDPATGLWAWRFTASNQIEIRAAYFSANSVYTIDYNPLYQVETYILDLGAAYQDYAWWADYYLWDRMDAVQGSYEAERPLTFSATNGRAVLPQESTMDMSTSSLWISSASTQNEVPQRNWRFLDAQTVEIDLAQLSLDAQYVLRHEERRVYEMSRLTVAFEHKSGTSAGACAADTWTALERNENVTVSNNHRYHQLRLSISGIRSVNDFKIRSLVFKGLNIHGVSPYVPGLTNVWS